MKLRRLTANTKVALTLKGPERQLLSCPTGLTLPSSGVRPRTPPTSEQAQRGLNVATRLHVQAPRACSWLSPAGWQLPMRIFGTVYLPPKYKHHSSHMQTARGHLGLCGSRSPPSSAAGTKADICHLSNSPRQELFPGPVSSFTHVVTSSNAENHQCEGRKTRVFLIPQNRAVARAEGGSGSCPAHDQFWLEPLKFAILPRPCKQPWSPGALLWVEHSGSHHRAKVFCSSQ